MKLLRVGVLRLHIHPLTFIIDKHNMLWYMSSVVNMEAKPSYEPAEWVVCLKRKAAVKPKIPPEKENKAPAIICLEKDLFSFFANQFNFPGPISCFITFPKPCGKKKIRRIFSYQKKSSEKNFFWASFTKKKKKKLRQIFFFQLVSNMMKTGQNIIQIRLKI